jgi:acid stress chaperone HdeB
MKQYVPSSIMLACALSSSALAQTQNTPKQIVDVSKVTCNDFVKGTFGDIAVLSVWLSGYYHGRIHNTKIDLKGYVENSKLVRDACASDLKQTVMQAIENQIRTEKIRVAPPPTSNEKKG